MTVGTGGDGGLVPPLDGGAGGDEVFPAPAGDGTGGATAGANLPAGLDGGGLPLGSTAGSAGSSATSSVRGRSGSAAAIGAALPVTGGVPAAEEGAGSGDAVPQVTTGLAQPILHPRNLGSDSARLLGPDRRRTMHAGARLTVAGERGPVAVNLMTWLRAEWDRIAGFGLVLLGVMLLFLGYQGVQETAFLAEQLAYIASGGLGGLFSLGLGVGLLLSADLHDEWYKLDRIEAAIRGEPLPDSTSVLDLMGEKRGAAQPVQPREASRHMLNASVPVDPGRRSATGVAGTPLALAMDWRATHRVKAVGLLALVLLLPLALSTAGWRRASTTAGPRRGHGGPGHVDRRRGHRRGPDRRVQPLAADPVGAPGGRRLPELPARAGARRGARPTPPPPPGPTETAAGPGLPGRPTTEVVVAAGLRRFHLRGVPDAGRPRDIDGGACRGRRPPLRLWHLRGGVTEASERLAAVHRRRVSSPGPSTPWRRWGSS